MDPHTAIAKPYLLFLGDITDDLYAKTATGIAHWRPEDCVGVWRTEYEGGMGRLPWITPERAVAVGARTVVIGAATHGGVLPGHWVAPLQRALAVGLDIANGLHTRLASIESLARAAAEFDRKLHDVRYPCGAVNHHAVGTGERRPGRRVLTVGTDCCVGKMFTALSIEREMRARGVAATFRATGQTGILIAGCGVPVDAVVSDFLSGAVEALAPANDPAHWDVIEGQGSLFHPSYAGVSLGLLHGAQPDALVLCHEAGRHNVVDTSLRMPEIAECIAANENAARLTNPAARVVGIALNTVNLSDAEARRHLEEVEDRHALPVGDPVRTGLKSVVDALLAT